MGPQSQSDADAGRLRRLRRMQAIALGLLLVAAVIYVLTHGHDGFLGYVNAAAEASMVGAVADWFAVTALFRRPLGLPIPHTALIPERKQALGESLEQFVTESFLTPEVARERTLAVEPALQLGRWLGAPGNAERVVHETAPALSLALGRVGPAELRSLIGQFVVPRLEEESFAPAAGVLLGGVVRDGAHRGLVDLVLDEAHRWLRAHEPLVGDAVRVRAPRWTPAWLDDQVVKRVYAEVLGWVGDIRADPGHPARAGIDSLLSQFADRLQHDPTTMAQAEALKLRLLGHPGFADGAVRVAESARAGVADALADPDGPLAERMRAVLVDLGGRLVDDGELRARIDARVADAATYVIRTYGREIAATISHTVDRWDGRETARRVELLVGRDLQFIRINGTVVGGLVGLAIHAASELL